MSAAWRAGPLCQAGSTKPSSPACEARVKSGSDPPASPLLLHAASDLVVAGMPDADGARQKGRSRSSLRRFLMVTQLVTEDASTRRGANA